MRNWQNRAGCISIIFIHRMHGLNGFLKNDFKKQNLKPILNQIIKAFCTTL